MKTITPQATLTDGFLWPVLHGVLPLVIWAAHFFLSYAGAEVACALRLQRFALAGVTAPTIWLWIITVAAIAMLVVVTLAPVRRARADTKSGDTLTAVRIGVGILALVGVVWSAVPIVVVEEAVVCVTTR